MENYILKMNNIVKEFNGVRVLDKVKLNVKKGEVMALMGENGAGKSTIMKCLIGEYSLDSGEIYFNEEKLENFTTKEALNKGIAMIHQELSPVLYRPIMENIWLGREPKNIFGLVDHKKMEEMTKEALKEIELDLNPKTLMIELTIAQIQMIEIAKALSYNAQLIIMDEPTSAITLKEVEQLFNLIEKLKKKEKSIIYISHKMDEIYRIADSITVFRDGKYVGEGSVKELKYDDLIKMMVGRSLGEMYPIKKREISKEIVLEVKNLCGDKFKNISFDLKKGEIIGVSGLVGAGRTELFETIFGCRKLKSGEIYLKNKKVEINNPIDAKKYKMALLTEDRKLSGIFPMLTLKDNAIIANIKKYINNSILINHKKATEHYLSYHNSINVKSNSIDQKMETLSGGNQQKVLLARWLMTEPEILFLDEPTRGIDIGAKSEIYKIMNELARQGKSIVAISSELPEIIGISDRIIVMKEGELTAIMENVGNVSQEDIMRNAT